MEKRNKHACGLVFSISTSLGDGKIFLVLQEQQREKRDVTTRLCRFSWINVTIKKTTNTALPLGKETPREQGKKKKRKERTRGINNPG